MSQHSKQKRKQRNQKLAKKVLDQELTKQAIKQAQPVKRGRPSSYTPEEGDRLCCWIVEGKSLRSYCKTYNRGIESIYRWLRENGEFRERYARAHVDRADTLADEILDISDMAECDDMAQVQKARLQVEARKWIASKLKPSKWGEGDKNTARSNVTFNIDLNASTPNPITIDEKPKPVLERTAD